MLLRRYEVQLNISSIFGDRRYGLSLPSIQSLKQEWFGNVRGDLLSGLVVALALIPEAIAFSIIAGVDPKVGLYASVCIAITISIAGGRPGMISAATGAMALLMITLVRDYGLEYLFAATILTGVLQIIFGVFKLGRYMKFVPKSVMIGFVNALAILIFLAQLPMFVGATWHMYAMVAVGLGIIYLFPRLTTSVPSPLVAIIVLTLVSLMSFGSGLFRVGDMGELPTALPFLHIPMVPFNIETLKIILPTALALTMVGLIESLLTASIVDEMTDTPSDKNRESKGQGIANIVSGFFGGMAGCAMIGQSVINVKSGGRGRLSAFAAGIYLLVFMLLLSDWIMLIPMGALVAVMFMVSISTFDWASLKRVRVEPVGETIVMVATVGTVVMTNDLALGVFVGIILSALMFARKVADIAFMESKLSADGRTRTYTVNGDLFFVTVTGFLEFFDFHEDLDAVVLDLSPSHVWDASAVDAIDKAVLKFMTRGVDVEIVGLNQESSALVQRLGVHSREPAMSMAVA